MIDYAYLCQAIQHWRAGQRPPGHPPLPTSAEVEELDADAMVDYESYEQHTYDAEAYAAHVRATQQGHDPYAEQTQAPQSYENYEGYDPEYES